MVELRDVVKRYRQRVRAASISGALRSLARPEVRTVEALRAVSLRVAAGEIVAYAGPNGAGKSTTIKLLAGLLAPDEGVVRVGGLDPVRDRVKHVGRIGVVFGQRTELWWDHPVEASFEWKRVVWNVPQETYDRMLGFVQDVLGVGEFMHTAARELSLGQKMRAELAMALLHEPSFLFLDEPTIGLDVLAKRNVLAFVRELNRERGVTVFVTSHDMSDLEELAGRIVMIDRGSIAYDGDFAGLRRVMPERRVLILETAPELAAPALEGADFVSSADGRHEYRFDPGATSLADLLQAAGAQARIRDVETHRPPIDEVVASLYESWRATPDVRPT